MDFDGDGISDILSGSWPGQLYFFKGEGKGKFAAGEKIKDKNGKDINLGSASTVFACDWRGTGKLDLLVGDISGHVWLVADEGMKGKPAYGAGVKLEASGKAITVHHGDSHPTLIDWEGTGTPGLLVGCGDGGVVWYRNTGTRNEPKFGEPVTLVPGVDLNAMQKGNKAGAPQPGMRAKISVCDWNGDGKLDLLVGDFSSYQGEVPKLTPEQEKDKAEIQKKLAQAQKNLQPYYAATNEVAKQLQLIQDPQQKQQKMMEEYERLAKRHQKELQQLGELHQALNKYQGGFQTHGHVWLYLRKAEAKAVGAP